MGTERKCRKDRKFSRANEAYKFSPRVKRLKGKGKSWKKTGPQESAADLGEKRSIRGRGVFAMREGPLSKQL